MKAETPAMGIHKQVDYDDFKLYYVGCDCADESHSHSVCVDKDPDIGFPTVSVEMILTPKSSKLRLFWDLVRGKDVEFQASIILNDATALNYAKAIENSIGEMTDGV